MNIQSLNGKAFEYACLKAFYDNLSLHQQVIIETTAALSKSEKSFQNASFKLRSNLNAAANAAVGVIVRLEPMLEHSQNASLLYLKIQEDSCGQAGDVRDILAIRHSNGWEIGLSVKHNHTAVKHSRLSKTIDFGNKWLGLPVSKEYFNAINPIFDELSCLRSYKAKWNQLNNKATKFYMPLLIAFCNELKSLNDKYPSEVPKRLLSYLLGKNDFYKVIAHDTTRTTQIQAFSLYGTLNCPVGNILPQTTIPKLHLPKRFHSIEICAPSQTTVQIVCDEGWTISLRVHNASTDVEPSLKFDITLVGIPPMLYTHHEPW